MVADGEGWLAAGDGVGVGPWGEGVERQSNEDLRCYGGPDRQERKEWGNRRMDDNYPIFPKPNEGATLLVDGCCELQAKVSAYAHCQIDQARDRGPDCCICMDALSHGQKIIYRRRHWLRRREHCAWVRELPELQSSIIQRAKRVITNRTQP
ncbi:uncharacterized protein BKA78DRAFT_98333 [Phyllosticta capitalensis]|uniref:uncharacterized protein n=1 Tax=Phyllosticta capitalensis TaxID=121624 RepID=UPI0031323290